MLMRRKGRVSVDKEITREWELVDCMQIHKICTCSLNTCIKLSLMYSHTIRTFIFFLAVKFSKFVNWNSVCSTFTLVYRLGLAIVKVGREGERVNRLFFGGRVM